MDEYIENLRSAEVRHCDYSECILPHGHVESCRVANCNQNIVRFCPFCGSMNVMDIDVAWTTQSQQDKANTATLNEYQCVDEEYRSFWA